MSARERTCADGLDKLIGRGIIIITTTITVGRPLGLLSNVIRQQSRVAQAPRLRHATRPAPLPAEPDATPTATALSWPS
jgi:hypothetical protein